MTECAKNRLEMTIVREVELGSGGGRAERHQVWRASKSRGNAEGTFTRQGAMAAVGDPLGCEVGHKLLGTGQQLSSAGRRRGSTRHL